MFNICCKIVAMNKVFMNSKGFRILITYIRTDCYKLQTCENPCKQKT